MSYFKLLMDADRQGLDRVVVANERIKVLQTEANECKEAFNSGKHNMATLEFIHYERMQSLKEIRYLEQHKNKKPENAEFTNEDIARARSFPIEQLIDFDRNGKALAFCHADKTPSLSLWKGKNLCRCFPCDKTFNSIDVMMELNGLTFYEAVRALI